MKMLLAYSLAFFVIIALGLGIIAYLESSSEELSQELTAIKDAVSARDWQRAEQLLEQTQDNWEDTKKVWSTLINHREIDQLEMTFAKLTEYLVNQEQSLALAELETAKTLVEHIPEKERLSLANLF